MLKVVYFASIREQLGLADEALELPQGISDVAGLRDWLMAERGEKWQKVLGAENLLVAVDQEMVGLEAALTGVEEVAFFPPVTGG